MLEKTGILPKVSDNRKNNLKIGQTNQKIDIFHEKRQKESENLKLQAQK